MFVFKFFKKLNFPVMKKPLLFFLVLSLHLLCKFAIAQPQYEKILPETYSADRVYDDSSRRGMPAAVMQWQEGVVRSTDGSYIISSQTPYDFTTMVLLWEVDNHTLHPEDFAIRYRVRKNDGDWTEIMRSEGAYRPGEVPRGMYVSELMMISDTETYDEFEIQLIPPFQINITRIEVDITDISGHPQNSSESLPVVHPGRQRDSDLEFPPYVPRTEWCLTDACINPTYNVTYIDATHTLIHYGASPNDYTNGAAVVAAYWDYHVNTNLWFDIGYNYLVDKFGNLFQGRHNPELPFQDVRAAHAGASNAVSIGVNFLGNTDAPALHPTEAQLGINIQLLAWWYDYFGFDPTTSADIILQDPAGEIEERYRISGHRDVGNTFCPGNVLYAELPNMRLEVLDAMGPAIYSIGDESVEGEADNFTTLREAASFLNGLTTFSGDMLFYITSDLEEDCTNSGIGIGIDPSPFTITFKPAPNTSPTISFHYPNDVNAGPSGAFIIGMTHDNNLAWGDATPTRNIIFDGSNTPGGTTRDMTITNTTGTHRNGMPLLLIGDVQNVTIKNLNVYHQATNQSSATQTGFNGALAFRVNHNIPGNNAPKHIEVDNCHISADFPGVSPGYSGVNIFKSASAEEGFVSNLLISNSLIEGKANGLFMAWAGDSIAITGNEIRANQNIGTGIQTQAAVHFPLGQEGAHIMVAANNISKMANIATASNSSMSAIDIQAGGNYLVANNMITGFDATAGTGHAGTLSGIRINNAAANAMLVYNSMLLNELENISGSTQLLYNGIALTAGNIMMVNNILSSNESAFNHDLMDITVLPGIATNNLYFYNTGAESIINLAKYNNNAYTTLEAWQHATGTEANSLFDNPMFVSEADLKIQDTSPALFAGTPLQEVTTDMFGSPRHNLYPCIGAHENPLEPELFTVEFMVEDEYQMPIFNAVITLGDVTNAEGDYFFVNILGGTYQYHATADGYNEVYGELIINDDIIELVILAEMSFITHTVSFDVKNPDGNEITDAIITFDGTTNPAGNYVFTVDPGTYSYTVNKFCYINSDGTVEVNADIDLEVIMQNHTGDANGDGMITVLDIIMIANSFVDPNQLPVCFNNADANGDGIIDVIDLIIIVDIFQSVKLQ